MRYHTRHRVQVALSSNLQVSNRSISDLPPDNMPASIQFAVLTSSDSGHAGRRDDIGGDAIVELMGRNEHSLITRHLEPDDAGSLTARLREWSLDSAIELILTTGGTGLGPRDVMPEATQNVIEYEVPGMAEAMRAVSLQITSMAMLSRAVVGVANRTLIVNLPGNPTGAIETLEVVLPVLTHAVEILNGTHRGDHPIRTDEHDH